MIASSFVASCPESGFRLQLPTHTACIKLGLMGKATGSSPCCASSRVSSSEVARWQEGVAAAADASTAYSQRAPYWTLGRVDIHARWTWNTCQHQCTLHLLRPGSPSSRPPCQGRKLHPSSPNYTPSPNNTPAPNRQSSNTQKLPRALRLSASASTPVHHVP